MNYLVTIQGHGDALISYLLAKHIKDNGLTIICNSQSVSLLRNYTSDEKIISDEFGSLYNIRKDGIIKAIKSWLVLIKYLRKVDKKDKIYFEKNDFRYRITKLLLRLNIVAPNSSSHSVYKKRQILFGTDFSFTYLINRDQLTLANKKVIIFPGSRVRTKEIAPNSIQQLFDVLKLYNTNIELHYFQNDHVPSIYYKKNYTKKFDNIKDMLMAIESADIVISADSLPLHVTYFLNKPVIPFYNSKINYDWLPIGIGDFVILNKDNKIILSEKLSRIWIKNSNLCTKIKIK